MHDSLDHVAGTARHTARKVAGWVPPTARVGYVAKGVVYILLGTIAVKAATSAGSPTGIAGALASLRGDDQGRLALLAIAIGLAAHVLWRLVQAVLDPEHPEGGGKRTGMRLFYAFSALAYGSLALTAWQLARRGGEAGEDSHKVWVAELLLQPYGGWLVMAAGGVVIAYGLQQVWKGLQGDVARHLGIAEPLQHRGLVALGRIGTLARGLVLLPVGWFVFGAGRSYRATEAGGTEEALRMIERGGLLTAVGVGLIAYGLFQVGKAVYRRITPPTV